LDQQECATIVQMLWQRQWIAMESVSDSTCLTQSWIVASGLKWIAIIVVTKQALLIQLECVA
jgi:hypothetical protein